MPDQQDQAIALIRAHFNSLAEPQRRELVDSHLNPEMVHSVAVSLGPRVAMWLHQHMVQRKGLPKQPKEAKPSKPQKRRAGGPVGSPISQLRRAIT